MRASLIVVALALVVVAAAISDVAAVRGFKEFRAKYNKQYNSPIEANRRFAIYRSNMDFIEAHNAKFAAGESTYEAGENEFIDLSSAEFVAQMNGYRKSVHAEAASTKKPAALIDVAALPTSVDWRTKGIVTGIKNQGQCGSCWSFSTTGSTEGQHALTTGSLVSLSEQNLVDCSTPEGNEGCGGGEMTLAFEYIIKNNGIDTEASYPYTATGPNKCQFNPANVGATLIHYSSVATGSESALQQASATVGPISVAIDASHQSFQVYKSGVYYEPACSTTQLDHGVLVVGYGASGSSDYYIVKNSWGTTWGMEGYIWMSRNRNNNCGIASDASWPIAPNATTSTVSAIATTTGPAASGAVTSAAASSGAQSSSGASGSSGASSGASSGSGSGSGSSGSSGSGNYGGSSGNYGSSSGNSGSSGQSSNSGSGSGSGASGQSSGSNAASSGAGNGSSGDSYSASSSGTSQDSAASNSAGYSSGYSGSLFSTTTGTAAGTTTGSTKH